MQTIRYGKARLARFEAVKVWQYSTGRYDMNVIVRRAGITSTTSSERR